MGKCENWTAAKINMFTVSLSHTILIIVQTSIIWNLNIYSITVITFLNKEKKQ